MPFIVYFLIMEKSYFLQHSLLIKAMLLISPEISPKLSTPIKKKHSSIIPIYYIKKLVILYILY